MYSRLVRAFFRTCLIVFSLSILGLPSLVHASQAYGSINNFDTVNDTGVPCHGFEIEIDDIHSKDITYTYDWNHYGVPKITEDTTDPLHPKVFVRYESAKNPDSTWAAFTAVPAGPISPTDGHQFTNPSVNFGGEHFGVGFYGTPTAVKYNWLIDDGAGHLIHGGAVNIATPTFAYNPPVNAVPAQVQAAIVPPPPPAPPVLEFGEASWVKEMRTSAHNNNKVELRDLVSDNPNDPNDRSWRNGEPDEVEVEWQLMQKDFNAGNGGPKGEMVGAAEDLPNGDEVITRRYDFFKYVGPLDPLTGEALADAVGPDGIHGVGLISTDTGTVDLSTVVVVGDYVGAQMAGFDEAGKIGLIDHFEDGEVNVPYVERTVVIGGKPPIVTTRSGALPNGMSFNEATGVLSGTPTAKGLFTFTIHSTDASGGDVAHTYFLTVAAAGVAAPPHSDVTTTALPAKSGRTAGDGDYANGTNVTVTAIANPGFLFVKWTESGALVSTSPTYSFAITVNRALVANFSLGDTTPDAFSFNPVTGAALNTAISSNTVTITGINSAAPISITGGTYSIDGGPFVSTAGTIKPGASVTVRLMSAMMFKTQKSAVLTIGGVKGTFTVTTLDKDTTPDIFSFVSMTGVMPDTPVISDAVIITGINSAATITIAGGRYSINGGAFTTAAGKVVNGSSVKVSVQSAPDYNAPARATVTIGGVSASFSVTTLDVVSLDPNDPGAVDDDSLITWTTGGDASWFSENAIYYSGSSALQSGRIGNGKTSWIQTTVNGPFSIAFFQKVSSQAGFDTLKFSIDGVTKSTISGKVNWQEKIYSVTTGTAGTFHTLRWTYAKNATVSNGMDAGWIDRVVVSPITKVAVLSPNGGEVLTAGTTTTITWQAPAAAEKFKVYYSINNGSSWIVLNNNNYVTGTSYDWQVPVTTGNKTTCKVKIVGYTVMNVAAGYDTSNAPFTIQVLKVNSPNGGETVHVGFGSIDYTISGLITSGTSTVASAKFYYTLNGGTSWVPAGMTSTASYLTPGSHTFSPLTVPAVTKPMTNCRIKVELRTLAGALLATDMSDAVFTIAP